MSSEIEVELEPIDAFFIPSSLITLNNQGQIGIKIIVEQLVKFVPVKILSDLGNGYWVKIDENQMTDGILIISQGQEYTVDGENVNINIKNYD